MDLQAVLLAAAGHAGCQLDSTSSAARPAPDRAGPKPGNGLRRKTLAEDGILAYLLG